MVPVIALCVSPQTELRTQHSFVKNKYIIWSIGVAGMMWLGDILLGGDPIIGAELVFAALAGLAATFLCGGVKTAMGLLYLTLAGKFLLIALPSKLVALEPWDSRLAAPDLTAHTLVIGFAVILLVALISRLTFKQVTREVIRPAAAPLDQLKIGYTLAIISTLAGIIVANVLSNRGLVIPFGTLGPVAMAYLTFYALDSKTPTRWLHVALLFAWQFSGGLLGGSKEGMFTPIAVIMLCILFRRGFKNVWLLMGAPAAALVSLSILFPYSQYVKSVEARSDQVAILLNFVFNAEMRKGVRSDVFFSLEERGFNYVGKDMGLLERFMLIKVTDQIIASTEANGQTGWFTISAGLINYIPRFMSQQKEDINVNNYLGRITGTLAEDDYGTSISYTVFGNLYNAFGLVGVMLGTFVCFFSLSILVKYLIGNVQVADPRVVGIVMLLQHATAEASFTDALGTSLSAIAFALVVKGVEMLHLANFQCGLPVDSVGLLDQKEVLPRMRQSQIIARRHR